MKKIIKIILLKSYPSLILILLSFLAGVFTGFLNLFLFILVYSLVFYAFLINEKTFHIVAVVISGIILDSVNDIALGLSSFIFLAVYLATRFEIKYVKVKDFLSTYIFFAVNILATIIFVSIFSFFVDTNFAPIIEFVIISLIIFPLVYNGIRIYKMIAPKSYEKY
ncbi:MAG: hypothetical protein LBQ34_00220 [Alphaproteobacteria bacterium]|jgi:hypothetical protein|nr:hypothetical protein [Alphaproteobacteria bacterium]